MKVEMEIKEDKFIFKVQVGEETHNHTSKLYTESLFVFTQAVQHCFESIRMRNERKEKEAIRSVYKNQGEDSE